MTKLNKPPRLEGDEEWANTTIATAVQAIKEAQEASDAVGYGTCLQGVLSEALKAAQYALDVVEGRA